MIAALKAQWAEEAEERQKAKKELRRRERQGTLRSRIWHTIAPLPWLFLGGFVFTSQPPSSTRTIQTAFYLIIAFAFAVRAAQAWVAALQPREVQIEILPQDETVWPPAPQRPQQPRRLGGH